MTAHPEMTILQVEGNLTRVGAGFYSCLCRKIENAHLHQVNRPWISRQLKKKRSLSRNNHQAKKNLTCDTNILCRVKSHYLNIHISLLLSIMVVMTHLKIKADFGVGGGSLLL